MSIDVSNHFYISSRIFTKEMHLCLLSLSKKAKEKQFFFKTSLFLNERFSLSLT